MTHAIPKLGLALAGLLVLAGLTASTAPADVFHAEQAETTLTGEAITTQVFKATPADEKEFFCETVSFKEGTLAAKSNREFSVLPKYEKCEATGPLKAFVEVEGCQFAFDGETDTSEHGQMRIECPEEKELRITVTSLHLKCIAIPSQTIGGIHYIDKKNEGGTTRDFQIDATATGVVSTTEESAAVCGSGVHEGTLDGRTTVKGQNAEKSPVGVWVEPSDVFHAEVKDTVVVAEALGSQTIKASVGDAGEINCPELSSPEATFDSKATESVAIRPEYQGCGAFEDEEKLAAAYVEANSCEYLLRGDTVGEPEEALARAYVVCEEPEDHIAIKVTAFKFKCFSITEQALDGVRYSNTHEGEGSSREVDATLEITGLVTTTENSKACPTETGETEVDENGSSSGEIALSGETTEEEAVGVWVE